MMSTNNICAVVVTYNRKELLLRNITAIMGQTYLTDILIFDNHSTDGTKEFLREKGVLDCDNIHYYESETNIGGAGGFSRGLRLAYDMGYDLFWLMDDDGYCYNKESLRKLIENLPKERNDFIINSTVICDDSRRMTFGFLGITTYEQLVGSSNKGIYKGYINPFNGTLISKGCIEKIGYPKGEFFLYGDEHEYMLRALKKNVYVATVLDSLYYHPVNRKIEYRKSWKYNVPIKDEPVWKTFCDVRNNIYITKKYDGFKMVLIKIYVYITAARFKKQKRFKYIKYTILGIFDGLSSNFSRPIMFEK